MVILVLIDALNPGDITPKKMPFTSSKYKLLKLSLVQDFVNEQRYFAELMVWIQEDYVPTFLANNMRLYLKIIKV